MIYELDRTNYFKVENLLTGDLINIEIAGVIQGFNPGWIFVDDINSPKTAMVWSKAIEGFYFIGDENNKEFNDCIDTYIDNEIVRRARVLGLDSFEFSGTSSKWDNTIEEIFKNRNLNKSKQLTYKNKKIDGKLADDIKLQDEYKLNRVTKALFNSEISNLSFLENMILDWWSSVDDFLNYGVGYCIIVENKIISCCITSCVTDYALGSHTVTIEEYRKKGLAKVLIFEFLKYCKENGLEAHWDCMDKNISSKALAESCGYKREFDYTLYEFEFHK
ncbi:MAG: GNAT family N-acetyltransferase [Firmicutes bacterium]|nr:GNAT family N-acetyltransferase [Bacillota bacterium]